MTRLRASRLRARLIQLAELTAPEAAKLAHSPKIVVIVPLGAIEQHGPHLPLLVDWRGAEELAYRIAPHLARAGWRPVLAPPIPYGVSTLAVGWPGTVSLTIATLRRLVVEVVSGLASHGFRRVVLTNTWRGRPARWHSRMKSHHACIGSGVTAGPASGTRAGPGGEDRRPGRADPVDYFFQ